MTPRWARWCWRGSFSRRPRDARIFAGLVGDPGRDAGPVPAVARRDVAEQSSAGSLRSARQVARDPVARQRREHRRGRRVPRQGE